MTDGKENLERKAFEEWYCSKTSESIGMKRYPNGRFRNPETENMYLAWRAAKNHAEQSTWISVEDRLPELNKEVLVAWSNGSVGIARHIKDEFEPIEWDTYGSHAHITHWQPLPEPIQNSTDE